MTKEDLHFKHQEEAHAAFNTFKKNLNINDKIIKILVKEGFSSLEELAYVPFRELLEIENLTKEEASLVRESAKSKLLLIELDKKNQIEKKTTSDDLLGINGMNLVLASQLAEKNIFTLEELANQGIDDLTDIKSLNSEQAGLLIMTARNICWFGSKV